MSGTDGDIHTTLVDHRTLAARIDSPDSRVIDCRFDLADSSHGERAYREAHIAGAHYAHLDRDL